MKTTLQSRSDGRRAILRFVIVVNATRAKIVVALFALAMLYGSVCSASCLVGVCPNLAHYSESHDCDQLSHHHSHGQHDPDCRHHAQPPDFAPKTSGIAPFQDQSATVLQAGAALASFSNPSPITQAVLEEFHRRPRGVPKNTPLDQVSVLRI